MGSNTLNKKCPICKRIRKYTVPEHQFPTTKEWHKVDGRWICCWCFARTIPNGEAELRKEQAEYRQEKKDYKKSKKHETHGSQT